MVLRSILVVFSLFLSGCSSSSFNLFGDDEPPSKKEKRQEISPGPSKSRSASFLDQTNVYGLKDVSAMNFTIVDFNFDGYEDIIYLKSFYAEPVFLAFDPVKQVFSPVDSIFKHSVRASYILVYDFNRDQVLDAVVGVFNQKTELSPTPLKFFKGTRNGFQLEWEEVKGAIPLKPLPSSSVIPLDANLDGYLDLYVANWFDQKKNSKPEPDLILINTKKNHFVAKTEMLEDEWIENPEKTFFPNAKPSYAASACDIDQNGFPDVLVGTSHHYSNKMWLNLYALKENKRYFKDFAKEAGADQDQEGSLTLRGGGRTFSMECADYNQDGIMDIFLGELTHVYDGDNVDKSSVLTGKTRSFPPQFIRTEYLRDALDPNWSQSDKRAIWFDYNNDSYQDILVDNSGYPPHTRLILFEQNAEHDFEDKKELGVDILNPVSSVILDIDDNKQWDILTGQISLRDSRIQERVYLFKNVHPIQENKKLRLHLGADRSNPHALGAMIELLGENSEGIFSHHYYVSQTYGALSPQNSSKLLYGLPASAKLKKIKVRWPYVESLNQSRNVMEKVYMVPSDGKDMEFTLCESGKIFIGDHECPKSSI